jgi:hypothetical protein
MSRDLITQNPITMLWIVPKKNPPTILNSGLEEDPSDTMSRAKAIKLSHQQLYGGKQSQSSFVSQQIACAWMGLLNASPLTTRQKRIKA